MTQEHLMLGMQSNISNIIPARTQEIILCNNDIFKFRNTLLCKCNILRHDTLICVHTSLLYKISEHVKSKFKSFILERNSTKITTIPPCPSCSISYAIHSTAKVCRDPHHLWHTWVHCFCCERQHSNAPCFITLQSAKCQHSHHASLSTLGLSEEYFL